MIVDRPNFINYTDASMLGGNGGRLGEERQGLTGLRVMARTDRAHALASWLSVYQDFIPSKIPSKIPLDSSYKGILLGEIETGDRDPLFKRILAGVRFNLQDKRYNFYTIFLPATAPLRLDRTFTLPPFDIAAFESVIKGNETLAEEYDFHVDEKRTVITEKQHGKADGKSDSQPLAMFGPIIVGDEPGFYLGLESNALSEDDFIEIPSQLRRLAKLTESIGTALYQAHGVRVPDKTLLIEPPTEEEMGGWIADAIEDVADLVGRGHGWRTVGYNRNRIGYV